ncbi:hypothetical protein ACWD4P_36475 [Kitasatospora sp. NPDC002543]
MCRAARGTNPRAARSYGSANAHEHEHERKDERKHEHAAWHAVLDAALV